MNKESELKVLKSKYKSLELKYDDIDSYHAILLSKAKTLDDQREIDKEYNAEKNDITNQLEDIQKNINHIIKESKFSTKIKRFLLKLKLIKAETIAMTSVYSVVTLILLYGMYLTFFG